MAVQRVGEMTLEELRKIIREEINSSARPKFIRRWDPVRAKAALDWLDEHIWIPPPGTPSIVELLREDRDR
jgi:hypothetical protein